MYITNHKLTVISRLFYLNIGGYITDLYPRIVSCLFRLNIWMYITNNKLTVISRLFYMNIGGYVNTDMHVP